MTPYICTYFPSAWNSFLYCFLPPPLFTWETLVGGRRAHLGPWDPFWGPLAGQLLLLLFPRHVNYFRISGLPQTRMGWGGSPESVNEVLPGPSQARVYRLLSRYSARTEQPPQRLAWPAEPKILVYYPAPYRKLADPGSTAALPNFVIPPTDCKRMMPPLGSL